ncbi:MAG: hypothetical protein WB710_04245, partial [Stellaceae bacterium]
HIPDFVFCDSVRLGNGIFAEPQFAADQAIAPTERDCMAVTSHHDELGGAMVPNPQPFGEVADIRRPATAKASDRQQRLVLTRGHADRAPGPG